MKNKSTFLPGWSSSDWEILREEQSDIVKNYKYLTRVNESELVNW
jgi:hypothetical protein